MFFLFAAELILAVYLLSYYDGIGNLPTKNAVFYVSFITVFSCSWKKVNGYAFSVCCVS